MNPIRLAQLTARIQERLASVLAFEMKDPRSRFITVTRVSLAKDLTQCAVFYSVLGTEADRDLVAHLLEHAKGFLERQVRSVLHTRLSPRLFFKFDESIEGAIRLSHRIDEVVAEDRARAAALGREPGGTPEAPPPAASSEAEPERQRDAGEEESRPSPAARRKSRRR